MGISRGSGSPDLPEEKDSNSRNPEALGPPELPWAQRVWSESPTLQPPESV